MASSDGTSSQCASSTATSSGWSSAAAASKVRVAAAIASRSPPPRRGPAGARRRAPRPGPAAAWAAGRLSGCSSQDSPAKGILDLGLVALDLQHQVPVSGLGGEREQAGLPDACVSPQQQDPGRFPTGGGNQAVEQLILRRPAEEHNSNYLVAGPTRKAINACRGYLAWHSPLITIVWGSNRI